MLVGDSLRGSVHFLLALLTTTSQPKHEVKGGLLLDIVIRKSPSILKLLTSEDETLLIRRNSLLILDFGLHILDRVRRLDVERDGFALNHARQCDIPEASQG